MEDVSTYHKTLKHQIYEPVILGQAPEYLSVRRQVDQHREDMLADCLGDAKGD